MTFGNPPRTLGLLILGVLALIAAFFCTKLYFRFDFEQFFPQGDEDLAFFREFKQDFESDDNFLIIAIPNEGSVFEQPFLEKIITLSHDIKKLDRVLQVQSLPTMKYPIKTPFGITSLPMIHVANDSLYAQDMELIRSDKRVMGTLINEKMNILTIAVKTTDQMDISASNQLIGSIDSLFSIQNIPTYHLIGRAYFQVELVKQQKQELIITSLISAILVSIIIFMIFKNVKIVLFSMGALGLSLLLFMGLLGVLGRELSVMSALYPVLILIVGTSDIIHIVSKYFDELRKGKTGSDAITITVKEIGTATLLTSLTTAVGFVALSTSRLIPIKEFGVNAGIGVMMAFVVVLALSILILPLLANAKIDRPNVHHSEKWDHFIMKMYHYSRLHATKTVVLFFIGVVICLIGISKVSTNYNVIDNLPRKSKVANDFLVFEREFSGFRPQEFAIEVQVPHKATDYTVVKEVNKIETYLESIPQVNGVLSQATLYKSLARMSNGNQLTSYQFPSDEETFDQYNALLQKTNAIESAILVSKDGLKTRMSTKVYDIGADSIKALGVKIDQWISDNIDASLIHVRRTGTGLIMDKNGYYVTESLMKGLLLAILLISLLMAMILKSWKMVLIAFLPNFIPLLFAGGLLGYFGIDLEAGVSIIFAVVFGIAVDDTIHFLTRFKLCINEGNDTETAIKTTFQETGKAIIFTTIILFFGFLTMLFSNNGPTFTVGLLVSVTLVSALICDLLLLPIMIRKFYGVGN